MWLHEPAPSPPPRPPTQAAEGLPRWRWTLAEFDRFIELGILDSDDKVELIGGELVQMPARGIAHDNVCSNIVDWLESALPKHIRLATELPWRPDNDTYCEPDIVVFPRAIRPRIKVPANEVLLLIEVADSTVKKDTTTKAALYARLGAHEYWVVDAFSHTTHIFRDPTANGYRRKSKGTSNRRLKPHLLPDIILRLADLPFANEVPPRED